MSWLDKINNDFIIVTGDGKQYKPNWVGATIMTDFNSSTFEYPEKAGTAVIRKQPKGNKYNLEIFFQGEDHLDTAAAFRTSANDPRAWTVVHPFYGSLIVQPLSLNYDSSGLNVSEIKGVIMETIEDTSPKITIDPVDKITQDKATFDETAAESFVTDVPVVDTDTSRALSTNITDLYNQGKLNIRDAINAEEYFNLFNAANTAMLNITSEPLAAMQALQALAEYPCQFNDSIESRIDAFINQFNTMTNKVGALFGVGPKKSYEVTGGAVVGSAILATTINATYNSRTNVVAVMEDVLDLYNRYIETLDSIQSDNGGSPESYVPDALSMIALNDLMNFCIANLFAIAIDSKQERSILCEEDTNIVILAHRFYGLEADDSTIDYIISTNEIGLNEMTSIPKGRRIVYYV